MKRSADDLCKEDLKREPGIIFTETKKKKRMSNMAEMKRNVKHAERVKHG